MARSFLIQALAFSFPWLRSNTRSSSAISRLTAASCGVPRTALSWACRPGFARVVPFSSPHPPFYFCVNSLSLHLPGRRILPLRPHTKISEPPLPKLEPPASPPNPLLPPPPLALLSHQRHRPFSLPLPIQSQLTRPIPSAFPSQARETSPPPNRRKWRGDLPLCGIPTPLLAGGTES
jgi:U5 snRNP spliceosome subunit